MQLRFKTGVAIIASMIVFSCSTPNEEATIKVDEIAAINANMGLMNNVVYDTVDGMELKMDVYIERKYLGEDPWWEIGEEKKPVLMYIHGGGWVDGEKETRFLGLLPFLAKKWTVVNINYRLTKHAKAPAAIVDCRKALDWIYKNADVFHFDTTQIVVAGESAGGHLALMTGLLEKGDRVCGDKYVVETNQRVMAIINWYGVTDMVVLDMSEYVWMDQAVDWDIAGPSLSPVYYLEKNSPPIITIHGSDDPVVPVSQAELLHEKCGQLGIMNKLITLNGKKHGDFSPEEQTMVYNEIWSFLSDASNELSR